VVVGRVEAGALCVDQLRERTDVNRHGFPPA
jgi:hypothetical protein